MDQNELLVDLEKLKTSNRRTLALMGSFALIVVIFAALDRFVARAEVRSHRFVLVDATGKNIATLTPEDGGACLNISSTTKASAASVCSADSLGSYVSLLARDGETQAMLSTGETTTEPLHHFPPGLKVTTQNGQKSFSVRLGSDLKLTLGDTSSGIRGMTVLVPETGEP